MRNRERRPQPISGKRSEAGAFGVQKERIILSEHAELLSIKSTAVRSSLV